MEGYVQIILQHQFAQNHNITTKKLQKLKAQHSFAFTRERGRVDFDPVFMLFAGARGGVEVCVLFTE